MLVSANTTPNISFLFNFSLYNKNPIRVIDTKANIPVIAAAVEIFFVLNLFSGTHRFEYVQDNSPSVNAYKK